jgi:hypothetical protein
VKGLHIDPVRSNLHALISKPFHQSVIKGRVGQVFVRDETILDGLSVSRLRKEGVEGKRRVKRFVD